MEMKLIFIIIDCVSHGTIDSCEWEDGIADGCDLKKFGNPE
jgi:hypothetical protein